MKKRFLFSVQNLLFSAALLGLAVGAYAQTTYYVSSTGANSNDGRSEATPFQTLDRVNSVTLRPGDQVLFRRGDTFRGTLQIRQSGTSAQPIIIDAYGSGSKPMLAASLPISTWTNVGGNVWQADASALESQVTGVYRNGAVLPLGRYPNADAPNKGYLTIQSHNGNSQLTGKEPLPANFSGGEVVERPVQWIINRVQLIQQNGNTLTLGGVDSYGLGDNWGYFIQNHPATLDQNGEWYFNPGNKTLRLYSDENPNNQLITATKFAYGISLINVSNVAIRNLTVTQTMYTGVLIENGTGITLTGNDITDSGEDGLVARGSGNTVLIENSLIEEVNNNGVSVSGYQNFTFRGNTLRRVGIMPGRGKNGDGTYIGFNAVNTDNVKIENNIVDQIGYNGINFTANTTVQRNRVSNFCLTKSDGGGIYIWNGNRASMSGVRILGNIVFNGIGAPEGTPGGAYSGANGIFLDDCTTNVEVRDNTVFNCHGLGFFLHGSLNAQFTNNTSYNNGEAQLAVNSRNGGCSPRDNLVQNNVLVSKTANQLVTKYESHLNDLTSFGQFDNNVYARPFNDEFKLRAVSNPGSGVTGADLSLAEWQGRYGKDGSSRNSPLTYKPFATTGNGVFKLNNTFGTTNEGWDVYSPYGNGRVTWDNANRLDGGSLAIGFPSSSGQSNSYALASKDIGPVSQNKVYLLTFDAIASGSSKRVDVFIRQKTGSYSDLDSRAQILVGTGRQHFEFSYMANASEASAIVVFQVTEDGQTLWIDNVQVQEATRTVQNPDDFTRIEYNDTSQDKTIALSEPYRDARNTLYTSQVTLAPFTSVVLFKNNGDTPPPPPVIPLRDPENPANAVAGLDYSYYEGVWTSLPDFNSLTAVKKGTAKQVDLAPRNKDDNFALQFKGYVNVPTDGVYVFYTSSDDGSKLYIGTNEVINNDGAHPDEERSGTIGLKAGRHAITISYYEGGGGEALSASYSGPGLNKQIIPASAFFRVGTDTPPPPSPITLRDPENPANTVAGLDYSYYEGSWSALPNFNGLTPVRTATASQADLNLAYRSDNFALQFKGYVNVPTDGVYTFYTNSDDGSKLFIGTTEIVNNDGGHDVQERFGSIGLKAGRHAITIPYFESTGGQVLGVSYSGPGISKQIIPASAYFRVSVAPPPPPAVSLRDPENPDNAVAGLDYGYYEGNWGVLPDFSSLTPARTGIANQADLNLAYRNDQFGLQFQGYVNVPTDGVYTFYTYSDDGSKLLIGTTEVVNNDGGHAEQERSGTIGLKAGRHAITIPYFEGSGGQVLSVSYSGPGIDKQVIPASAYFRVYTAPPPPPANTGTGTGLLGQYFNNKSLTAPVVFSRTDAVVDFDWGNDSPAPSVTVDNFSVRWTGQVEAPVTGNYVFTTIGDDGIRLWVNDVLVINDWNDHAPTTTNSNSIALVAGQRYNIRVEYYENIIGAIARLRWTYPGQAQQTIPQIRLYPASASARVAAADERDIRQSVVFPVPARDELTIRYMSEQAGTATVQLITTAGIPVLQADHPVTAGENLLKLPVRELTRGFYLLKLTQGRQQRTWKVLLSE
ncbi:PA14 domain-containing protein [Fibrella forsythiae]|uniref:Right-handed parallel beta-helix repeat-containing protein n=1 Tax=Fibrella forsythiae TaxID=2817061 RepID=A0ABS3JGX7_9BACT|nr:PA14 domain-containing protein [Fibrella forsythiae]MBO0949235.1 right-handed parallel beta-helix repeat-containing protein [Fibrella forsythiae]